MIYKYTKYQPKKGIKIPLVSSVHQIFLSFVR